MTPGQGFIPHGGYRYGEYIFLTEAEARWAVFFAALRVRCHYDPSGDWGLGNAQHYQPQFRLPDPPRASGDSQPSYFEVQRPDDDRIRHALRDYHPEIKEHAVYLAEGDLPDEQQLGATGWWDPGRRQGVWELTPCFEWEMWFPCASPAVLQALEAARAQEFASGIPSARQPEEGLREIPEREREPEDQGQQ